MDKHYEPMLPLEVRGTRICDKENLLVATVCDERDAHNIVRCVNSHEALVQALMRIEAAASATVCNVEWVAEYARKTLADAGEKQ